MKFTFSRHFLLYGLLLLAACGNVPARPAPPVGVRPSAAPTATGVDMARLRLYTHPSKFFQIDVPEQWQARDSSTSSEIVVHFTDREENAAIQTNLLTVTQQLDAAALAALLQTYLAKTYGGNVAFSQQPGAPQPDGTVAATWRYDATAASGSTARMHGTSVIAQRGACVSVLSFVVPEQQYAALEPQITAIRASYQVAAVDAHHAVAADGPLLQTAIGDLQPYSYANGLFTLNVPTGWLAHDRSAPGKASMLWEDSSGNAWLMVDVLKVDSQRTEKERTALLRDVLISAFGKQNGFALGAPEAHDGEVRIVWTYRAAADNGTAPRLQGESVIVQHGDKVAIITITLPASEIDTLQTQRGEIIKSFVLDEAAPLA